MSDIPHILNSSLGHVAIILSYSILLHWWEEIPRCIYDDFKIMNPIKVLTTVYVPLNDMLAEKYMYIIRNIGGNIFHSIWIMIPNLILPFSNLSSCCLSINDPPSYIF